MSKPLFIAAKRDIRRGVQSGGGGGDPVPPSGDALRYNPGIVAPLNSGFSTYNVGVGSSSYPQVTITLAAGEHAKIVLPTSQAFRGRLVVSGPINSGNTIWIIGGQIECGRWVDGENNTALEFRGCDKVYVEGLRLDKKHFFGNTITCRSRSSTSLGFGTLWLQNTLCTGVNYRNANHADFLQYQTQGRGLYLHQCTFYSWVTGFLFNSNNANDYITGPFIGNGLPVVSKVNTHCYDSRFNPMHTVMPSVLTDGQGSTIINGGNSWQLCDSDDFPNPRWEITDSYAWHDRTDGNKRSLGSLVRPHPNISSNDSALWGTVSGDPFTGLYTAHANLTAPGKTCTVRGGIPPNGDYVNGGLLQYGQSNLGPTHSGSFTGLNYPQPGTSGHPGYQ